MHVQHLPQPRSAVLRIRVNNWDEVSFILILSLVTVTGIDLVSKAIRWRFIQAGTSVAQRQHQEA